jgi:hypothetical protein
VPDSQTWRLDGASPSRLGTRETLIDRATLCGANGRYEDV